jgi:hypothetical protein
MVYFQWILSGNSKSAFILPSHIRTARLNTGRTRTSVKPTSREPSLARYNSAHAQVLVDRPTL